MNPEYTSQSIDHLGMVSAMFDELGIAEIINKNIEQDVSQRIVSAGQAMKAMVLNGLGFSQRRLYLTPHFFSNKPVEHLLGTGIKAEHLNDDTLGQALDEFQAFGINQLFNLIAINSVKVLKLEPKTVHDDITSFHVDGKYNSHDPEAEVEEKKLVRISQGYSRDSKPALNQVALELICEHQASLPIAMNALSGCESDKTAFEKSVKQHASHLQSLGILCVIKDSAGYTTQSLMSMKEAQQKWIMRVPNTIKAVKTWMSEANYTQQAQFKPLLEGYTYQIRNDDYAGIPQRWLLIHSQAAYLKEYETQKKRLLKASQAEYKNLEVLMNLEFTCESDAKAAYARVAKKLVHLKVLEVNVKQVKHFDKVGRPSKGSQAYQMTVQLDFILASQADALRQATWQGSLFVLATNELDITLLTDQMVLLEYKGQQKVESGFKFLKDPMFLASTIFLKKIERVMALLMVMTVCLLVYAALEYRIRRTLEQHKVCVPDQKGKPTISPTTRWVFALMSDVHLLCVVGQKRILTLNLRSELRVLLELLGVGYTSAYP
jgi:transposase